jgi:hypothetical protein
METARKPATLLATRSALKECERERRSIEDAHAGVFRHPWLPLRWQVAFKCRKMLRDRFGDCVFAWCAIRRKHRLLAIHGLDLGGGAACADRRGTGVEDRAAVWPIA